MSRRVLRPSFVVTFALGAAAIASACGGKDSGNGGSGDAGCPALTPTQGDPCDLPSSGQCFYPDGTCFGEPQQQLAVCQQGTWSVGSAWSCNPPAPVPEAGPDVHDAASDVSDAGPDVVDGGPDGEGQDAGHD
jgi:hypothetical protein